MKDCGTLQRQDVYHHTHPMQTYRLCLITPIPYCHFLLPFTTSLSPLLHVHTQCLLTGGTLMSFLLCHWILMKSLENKNKTLIAPHAVLETPHYSTDKTDDALVWFCVNIFKPVHRWSWISLLDFWEQTLGQRGQTPAQRTLKTGLLTGSIFFNNIENSWFGAMWFPSAI